MRGRDIGSSSSDPVMSWVHQPVLMYSKIREREKRGYPPLVYSETRRNLNRQNDTRE